MKKQYITFVTIAVLSAGSAMAQKQWNLKQCIEYAIEHNLTIKQQEAAKDESAVDLRSFARHEVRCSTGVYIS